MIMFLSLHYFFSDFISEAYQKHALWSKNSADISDRAAPSERKTAELEHEHLSRVDDEAHKG